jgi:predicted secreted Zn-dependent protease
LRSVFLFLIATMAWGPALALEKCVGADGKISYSDRACPAGVKRSSVGGAAPPANLTMVYYDVAAPGGHTGHTDWFLSYQYTSRSAGGACQVDRLSTKLEVKIRMPRWNPPAGADPALVGRWDRYASALLGHEYGHANTGSDFERNFSRAAATVAVQNCGELDRALRAQFDSLLKQANAQDIAYDAQTGHGATQGAVFR